MRLWSFLEAVRISLCRWKVLRIFAAAPKAGSLLLPSETSGAEEWQHEQPVPRNVSDIVSLLPGVPCSAERPAVQELPSPIPGFVGLDPRPLVLFDPYALIHPSL
jgi:hypothetical protein